MQISIQGVRISAGVIFLLMAFIQNISFAAETDDKAKFTEALELAKIGGYEAAAYKFEELVKSTDPEVSGTSMRAFGDCLIRLGAYNQAIDKGNKGDNNKYKNSFNEKTTDYRHITVIVVSLKMRLNGNIYQQKIEIWHLNGIFEYE